MPEALELLHPARDNVVERLPVLVDLADDVGADADRLAGARPVDDDPRVARRVRGRGRLFDEDAQIGGAADLL